MNQKENMEAHMLVKLAADTFIDRIWVSHISGCICDIIESKL